MNDQFRQEHKYQISAMDAAILRHRLGGALRMDAHADPAQGYLIRSLYFDTGDYRAYYEKLDGLRTRSKFRLRCYDLRFSYVVLEKKERSGDLCRKTALPLPAELAARLARGERSGGGHALLDEFDALRAAGMRPTVLVEYRRHPFVYPTEHVRITLDSALCTALGSTDFYRPTPLYYPVMAQESTLLEVKYNQHLPGNVSVLLQGIAKTKIAMSKYTQCLSALLQ